MFFARSFSARANIVLHFWSEHVQENTFVSMFVWRYVRFGVNLGVLGAFLDLPILASVMLKTTRVQFWSLVSHVLTSPNGDVVNSTVRLSLARWFEVTLLYSLLHEFGGRFVERTLLFQPICQLPRTLCTHDPVSHLFIGWCTQNQTFVSRLIRRLCLVQFFFAWFWIAQKFLPLSTSIIQ